MKITRVPDGIGSDGQTLFAWHLENQNLKAVVSEYGVRLMALRVRDKHHEWRNVILGLPSSQDYLQDTASLGAVVGRFANRVRESRYIDNRNSVLLNKNHGVHHLHGGEKGFEHVFWRAEAMPNGIRFNYISADGEQGYPGELRVAVTLSLFEQSLSYHYRATTSRDTIINLTNHAYFNLDGADTGEGDITDHQLQIEADRYLPIDQDVLPTGEVVAVDSTVFDFSQPAVIKERLQVADEQLRLGLGFDHCFVLKQSSLKGGTSHALSQPVASLYSPQTGILLEIMTTEPGLQLYTGNYLPKPHAGLCLETQHFPDSPNMPHFPSTRLAAGAVFESTSIYRLTRKELV